MGSISSLAREPRSQGLTSEIDRIWAAVEHEEAPIAKVTIKDNRTIYLFNGNMFKLRRRIESETSRQFNLCSAASFYVFSLFI